MPDYLIKTTVPTADAAKPAQRERIVRAKNEAAAIKHVVSDTISIDRATVDDAMRLAPAGVKVELAAGE